MIREHIHPLYLNKKKVKTFVWFKIDASEAPTWMYDHPEKLKTTNKKQCMNNFTSEEESFPKDLSILANIS